MPRSLRETLPASKPCRGSPRNSRGNCRVVRRLGPSGSQRLIGLKQPGQETNASFPAFRCTAGAWRPSAGNSMPCLTKWMTTKWRSCSETQGCEERTIMKPIRDAAGNVVGYESEANPNRRELRSRSGGPLAWYDKNTPRPLTPRTAIRALAIKRASSFRTISSMGGGTSHSLQDDLDGVVIEKKSLFHATCLRRNLIENHIVKEVLAGSFQSAFSRFFSREDFHFSGFAFRSVPTRLRVMQSKSASAKQVPLIVFIETHGPYPGHL